MSLYKDGIVCVQLVINLDNCSLPIIRLATLSGGMSPSLRTAPTAASIPWLMFGVVGCLQEARTPWSGRDETSGSTQRRTESVFVPDESRNQRASCELWSQSR